MPFKITHLPLSSTKVTNEQGLRLKSGEPKIHDGIDLRASVGTDVYATHSGKIIKIATDTKGYGNIVVLQHQETGMLTFYAHLDSFTDGLEVGSIITEDQAKNGFVIAKSGKTGPKGTEQHLHFEIMQGNYMLGSKQMVFESIRDAVSPSPGIDSTHKNTDLSAPRLNPRPFLANYAIETTMANLAAIEAINHPNQSSVFLGTYESLDVVNKNKVDDLSSEIFSKDIDLTDKITIDVEGDKRPNIITINKNGDERFNKQIKHLSGLDNNDIYKFEGKIFGQINIEDSNGTIILNNTKLENLKPTIVINETNQPTPLRLMKIGDKEYYLTRCDDKGNGYPTVIDYDYAVQRNLLIVPLGAADIRDSIMVRDFFSGDGKQAKDFGIIYDEDKLARIDFSNSNKADIIGREISSNTILLPNKNFIFTYNAIDGAVMAQIIDKAGNKIGSAIQIRDGSDITNNNIMPLSGGRFAIVNSVPNPINPNNNLQTYQLYIRTFDSDLSLVSNLKVTTEYDVISAGSENGSSPAFLYAIADDGLAVVYTKGFNVFQLQQFDKNGNKIGEEMPVHGAGSNYNVDSNTTKPFATISLHGLGKHQPISIYNKENSNIPDQWYVNNGKKYGKIYGNDGNLIAEIVSSAISEKSLNLPKIAEIKTNQIPLENNKKSAELEGDNDFKIASKDEAKYQITDFAKNGQDTIDASILDNSDNEFSRRLRFLQTTTNSSAVKVELSQIGSDTKIYFPDFKIEILLLNYSQENFKAEYIIGAEIDFKRVNNQINQPNSNTQTTTNSGTNNGAANSNNLPNNTGASTSLPNNPSPSTPTITESSSSNPTVTQPTTSTSIPITPKAQIANTNQTLIFDQMAASIPFNDITIAPINLSDKFEVKLILTDKNGNPVKGAMITKGETADGKYRSNYDEKTGIWQIVENFDPYDDKHITGTPAKVTAEAANELLKGNAIHALDQFIPKDFAINVYVRDVTNNQIYNNQIQADYQCMEIPDDLVKSMVRDQKSEVNKTLVMNFVNYLKDPRDRRFIGAEFKLMQAIRNDTIDPISNDSLLEIREFNKTTFEINGNKPGNYTMDFGVEQCNKFINHHFNLELTGNSSITDNTSISSNSNNLGTIIGASIGGAALLTAIGVAIWQRDKIKQCFNYLTGKGKNNEIEKRENKNEIELPANQDREHVDFQEVNKKNISMREIEERPDEIMNLTNNQKRFNSMELPKGSPIIKDINSLKSKNNQIEIG